jgi:hypothetical protein
MKPFPLLLATLALPALAQGERPVAFRDAATHSSLSGKFREVSLADPMKKLTATEGEDPTVVNRVGNLLENSDVITFNGQTTLVPKNALVLVPEKFSERINNPQPGTQILSWLDFYTLNRGWISTVEVTFAQARGDVPVSPENLEALGKSGNLIVAVLKSGPISVMPPKPEKPEQPIETASQSTQP